MKFFLVFCLIFLLFCGLFGYFYDGRPPQVFYEHIAKQYNPFTVPKDSAEKVWQRAKDFLELRKLLIVGGNLHIHDSLIYLPYYNDFHKGNSLIIERHMINDSVRFFVIWWYSGDSSKTGSKEVALYMQKGVDRYHLK